MFRPRSLFCILLGSLGSLAPDYLHGYELPIPALTADGFAVPQPNPSFSFPRDHGSHPDYKIEWWYVTGHLFTGGGASDPATRRFGFQATFFRSAASRASGDGTQPGPAAASFGHDQIYLAHMALIDVSTGRFLHQERLNRAGWDAAAALETLDVRNGDWSLARVTPPPRAANAEPNTSPESNANVATKAKTDEAAEAAGDSEPEAEVFQLVGGIRGDARFALTFTARKPLVRFGDAGYSRKGTAPTAASYYLTFPRLATRGRLTLDGVDFPVVGEAWMDHEYSSSQLDTNQVGWDWLSAQFHDGRELMFYRLRTTEGGTDAASTLTWIDRAGRISRAPFRWEPLTTWKSPHTGAVYPQKIRLTTTDPETGEDVVMLVEPVHPDQELGGGLGGITYWEGACRLLSATGAELGSAYLELTGYDRPVEVLR